MKPEEIVEFSEALARIVATGGGSKALAAQLAKTAGGGVLLEDAQWRHLVTAGTGPIPPSARPVVEARAPGRAHRVAAGPVSLGWLSLFGTGSAPDAEILLRLTAAAIGIELARDGTQHRRDTDFWEALFGRAFHDATTAREDAATRGIALAPQYIAVALEVECTEEAHVAGAFDELRMLAKDLFRSPGADVGLIQRGGMLLVAVPAARPVDASNAQTAASLLPKNVARRKPHLRISGGVGTVEAPILLHASATAAEAALAIARRLYGAGRVCVYGELGAYRLLYEGADVERLRRFASETLAPLRNYDEKHQTELERTLKLYFKVGQNVKIAAAEFSVHRHTIFYRLRQIGDICSRSLDTPHDQLTLRLAVAIDELHDSA